MPRLTTNYSESLAKLIRSNNAPIDGMEVGPWLPPERIRHIQQETPDWPIQFHAGSFITGYRYWYGALGQLTKYHDCTQSEWVSLYIELLSIWVFLISSRIGVNLPPPNIEQEKIRFIRILSKLKTAIKMPILLENLPSFNDC